MITDTEYNRLCWHSRRGMLELDLVLGPFIQNHFKQIPELDQQRYVYLLTQEDQDLYRWFLAAERPDDTELCAIIDLILELHHRHPLNIRG